jgi:chromosomal replication initiation ATPase DnaA
MRINVNRLLQHCADELGVDYESCASLRVQEAVTVRRLAIAVMREHYMMTYRAIADKMGWSDHSAAAYQYQRYLRYARSDDRWPYLVKQVIKRLTEEQSDRTRA